MNGTQLAGRAERAGNRVKLPFASHIALGRFVRETAKLAKKDRLHIYAGNLGYHSLFAVLLPSSPFSGSCAWWARAG